MDQTRHEQLRQKALATLGGTAQASEAEEGLRVVEAELELQAEELQRAYAASESAKRRYEQLFRSAPVGLLVLDSVQLIMEANDAAAEFLRAPPRLLFGVSMTQFLHPGELARWSIFLQRTLPTEFAIRRWGGDRAVARLKMLKVDGQSALLAIEDLTDLRASALQPRGALPPYLGFFRASPDPAIVLDPQTRRVVEVSEGLCALMGASRADLLERKQEDLFAVQDRPRASLVVESLARQPESQTAAVAFCSRGGEEIPVDLSAAANAADGLLLLRVRDRRTGGSGIFRSAAMHEAERLEAVARLAGGVAHDLNNVLTAITSTADVLRADAQASASRAVREGVDDLRSAAAYGVGVARSLLQLTRQGPRHHVPFDLAEVVRSALRLLERALPIDLRLRARLPDQPCVVEGNPTDWERVLINLAFNSSDACPAGGEVELRLEPGEGVHVLTVQDNGTGMSPEVRARAFEPFYTTKEPGRGTGQGLPLCWKIVVEGHGGTLTFRTRPGEGTTFVVRVPIAGKAEAPAPLARAVAA